MEPHPQQRARPCGVRGLAQTRGTLARARLSVWLSCAAPILATIAPIKRRQPRLARCSEGNEYFPYYPYFFICAAPGDAERPLIFKLGEPGAEMLVDLFNQVQSSLWVAICILVVDFPGSFERRRPENIRFGNLACHDDCSIFWYTIQ
jgi:hypothetical protein